jgi:hypothetical protein
VLQFATFDKPSLWTVTPNIMLLSGLVALSMPNGMANLLHLYPRDAGTATGLNGSGQFMIAGLLGVALVAMHDGTPLPMALTMLLAATVAWVSRILAGRHHDLGEIAPGQENAGDRAPRSAEITGRPPGI